MRDEYVIQDLNPRNAPYTRTTKKLDEDMSGDSTELSNDEMIDSVAARILEKFKAAFQKLAD